MCGLLVIDLDHTDPFSRGLAYGEAARDRISLNLEVYRRLFMETLDEGWEAILDRGRVLRPPAAQYAPDLIREVEGIAQGANRSFEEVFLLNARSEILFCKEALGVSVPDECTALLAMPEITYNHEILLAQNWDWYQPVIDGQVMLKIAGHDDIPKLVTFTEAGQVAKLGLNECGIGLTINNLTCDCPRVGVPWIFISRRILESRNLTEATARVFSAERTHSINYIIGRGQDEDGMAFCLETAPVEEHIICPRDGFLVHTNHFLEPCRKFNDLKFKKDPFSSSLLRVERVRRLLEKKCGRLDETAIKKILADHFDAPYSVCYHTQPHMEGPFQIQTCLSLVMNLNQKKIHYGVGAPCEAEWQEAAV